jgi:nitroimidazol reductase NimA-like FMN-containing flavoprotein (pyridoxamine 5'-phosphate oxidase superfamily)
MDQRAVDSYRPGCGNIPARVSWDTDNNVREEVEGVPGNDDQMEVLDRRTSLELLGTVGIGRLAWAAENGHAVVVPVNFVVEGDSVIFRTSEGSKLDAIREGHLLSFEADDVEPALHVGWSVLVTGVAEIITDPDELRRLEELPLAPWAMTPKPFLVRIRAGEVTGRRLPLHPGGVTIERQE